ncbi:tail assembly chaperone [Citrobacter freundii]|uniref:tail fiber assembly protein n=1 Tax=Citrobacter sp. MGH103 TaxID=1686378 RepID=UPI00065258F2|nr:tail assembly chaperone [Citrobacter sp. MGH103]HAT3667387.1 tail assembly chaperone [Citrobacter freundii]HCA1231002.1 tail assembly chaperone [Citrobacter freundii]HCA1441459.1 tail assembly chaperone [Citrobacter freundii]HCA1864816.1 tail assembly chaperone [Citrobacter freundii]HCA2846035.1 tail assembly chaperone [Citrobacter freundii]
MYLFSRSTLAFYPDVLRNNYEAAGTLPEDVIEVSGDIRDTYNGKPPTGKRLGINSDGMPIWVDIPVPTKEVLIQNAENERQRLLKHADAVMLDWRTELLLGEISDANRDKLSAWMAYKNEVKSADVTTDPERVNWPVPPEA